MFILIHRLFVLFDVKKTIRNWSLFKTSFGGGLIGGTVVSLILFLVLNLREVNPSWSGIIVFGSEIGVLFGFSFMVVVDEDMGLGFLAGYIPAFWGLATFSYLLSLHGLGVALWTVLGIVLSEIAARIYFKTRNPSTM